MENAPDGAPQCPAKRYRSTSEDMLTRYSGAEAGGVDRCESLESGAVSRCRRTPIRTLHDKPARMHNGDENRANGAANHAVIGKHDD